MANTYTFTTPNQLQVNDGPVHLVLDGSERIFELDGTDFSYRLGPYAGPVKLGTDTVVIDGTTFTGTGEQLLTALAAVFPSSSGGASGDVILQAPDNGLWKVGVENSGALVTTSVGSGTPSTVTLTSPDNTQWSLTVNNAGALQTTAI